MSSRRKTVLLLTLLLIIPGICYLLLRTGENYYQKLPVYNAFLAPLEIQEDETYHRAGAFSFRDRNGRAFTQADLKEFAYVAGFIPSVMNSRAETLAVNTASVASKYRNLPGLRFVTFVAGDSVQDLERFHAFTRKYYPEQTNWLQLWGEEDRIRSMMETDYLLEPDTGGILSEMLVLVDRRKRIRGFYKGTEYMYVDTLKDEIMVLLKEELNDTDASE